MCACANKEWRRGGNRKAPKLDNAMSIPEVAGHEPTKFGGQKLAILEVLREARVKGEEVPSWQLTAIALQYGTRIWELRAAGFVIANRTFRRGQQVCGAFRLVAEPGEDPQQPLFTEGC